ncbi:putative zinc-ribbon domain [Trema orientale]|uniref:Putative zinc-ribbon domain n=1 Tax=Trema orientale TaxID=63057 RepID=A0A2P5BIM5_TREOI|nr:putative zinc-ribbon domain [Trema orientale]
MASESTTKVRLVRCPKCRLVLPELPEFNVYKCGGCGATLQAKNRAARSTGSGLNDADAAPENRKDNVHEGKEEPTSSNKDVIPGSGECSSSQINERDQRNSEDFDGEQLGDLNVPREIQNNGTHHRESSDCDVEGSEASNEVFSPTEFVDNKNEEFALNENDELADNENEVFASGNEELTHKEKDLADSEQEEEIAYNEIEECKANGNEELAHSDIEEFAHDEEEIAPNEIEECEVNGNEESDTEEFAHNEEEIAHNKIEKCEVHGNEELAHSDIEEFAHTDSEQFARSENEEFARKESEAHKENEEFSQEFAQIESEEFTQEVACNGNEECIQASCNENEEFSEKKNDEFAQNQNEKFISEENESLAPARADLEVPVDDESFPLAEENIVHTSNKIGSDSNVRSSKAVNSVATMGNGSSPTSHMSQSFAPDTRISSPSGQLKQPRKTVHQGFGHLRSEELIPSSELSGTLGEMSKSPTRSSHAYDGSISSYDGMDDKFLHRHLHSFENTYKAAHFLHSEERTRREKKPARTMMSRDPEMQHQARPSWSDKKKHSTKNSRWDRDEFLEPARHERTVQNWRLERPEHQQPSSFFHRMSSRASYENRRPSSQLHDEFHRHSSFQSYDRFEDPEQVKMRLLTMVLELQDRLNNNYSLHDKENDRTSGLSSKERYIPRYHNYEPLMEERFHHSNYPRYSGRYGAASNSSHRRRFKKIPFSGEATSSSSQYDPSRSHCCPPNWQRSAQLPPPSHYNTSGQCRIHPGHNYCTCYSSCPSSPQWSVGSEYPPWGHEIQSDDQRRRSQDMTNYWREKHHSAKRHFRPIAGGAPFMVCYNCFKLLQLPADFLLFKKKCHRLRCGACLEVLKFSLQKGSHIVRYEVNVDPPPPSEAEDYGDDIDRRNVASTSQTPHADPVSCSDDYGLSYRKSGSTEGDPASSTPFHTPRGSTVDKRMSQDSFDLTRDRKEFIRAHAQGKNKSLYAFSGPAPNIPKPQNLSTEIEELPPRSTSPLHRLMGYSSPSEVIFGSDPSGRGASTSYSMPKEKRDKN